MFMLPLFAFLWRRAERPPFSLHFSFFQKSLNSGGLKLPSPSLGLKRCFQSTWKKIIRLGHLLLPPSSSMTLTRHLFTIVSMAIAFFLKFFMLPPLLLLRGASERGLWLHTNSTNCLSLFPVLHPKERSPFLNFQKAICPSAEKYSSPLFPFQVWPDLEWNQDSRDLPREIFLPLTRLCFLLLLLGRFSLLMLHLLLGNVLPLLWSASFPLHAPALISLFLTKVRLSLTLTLYYLTTWWSRKMALFFFFDRGGSDVLANCSLCSTEVTLSFSAGLVCSSVSAEACAILQALRRFR